MSWEIVVLGGYKAGHYRWMADGRTAQQVGLINSA